MKDIPKTVIHLETVERENGNVISHFQGSVKSMAILLCGGMIVEKSFLRALAFASKMYIEIKQSGVPFEELVKKEELKEEEFNAS